LSTLECDALLAAAKPSEHADKRESARHVISAARGFVRGKRIDHTTVLRTAIAPSSLSSWAEVAAAHRLLLGAERVELK
jgi:hypothetical protein